MNKKELPLAHLRKLKKFVDDLLLLHQNFQDSIYISSKTDSTIEFRDLESNSNYKFFVDINRSSFTPRQLSLVYFEMFPASGNDLKQKDGNMDTENLIKVFEGWGRTIRAFNEINVSFKDPFIARYEQEFYDSWKLVDEDADNSPFDLKRQLIIDKTITSLIKVVDEFTEVEDVEEIKKDLTTLKEKHTSMTKNEVVRRLSKVFAKARSKGWDFLCRLYSEAEKYLFKSAITRGWDMLGDFDMFN